MTLSPQQFFHGSRSRFEPGDVLLPSAQHGAPNYDYQKSAIQGDDQYVFVTPSESEAWTFAGHAPEVSWQDQTSSDRSRWSAQSAEESRPYVYEVEAEATPPPHRSPHTPTELTAPRAVVKRRIDVPPPDAFSHDTNKLFGRYHHNAVFDNVGLPEGSWPADDPPPLQGTLPPVDWSHVSLKKGAYYLDEVAAGVLGSDQRREERQREKRLQRNAKARQKRFDASGRQGTLF